MNKVDYVEVRKAYLELKREFITDEKDKAQRKLFIEAFKIYLNSNGWKLQEYAVIRAQEVTYG